MQLVIKVHAPDSHVCWLFTLNNGSLNQFVSYPVFELPLLLLFVLSCSELLLGLGAANLLQIIRPGMDRLETVSIKVLDVASVAR